MPSTTFAMSVFICVYCKDGDVLTIYLHYLMDSDYIYLLNLCYEFYIMFSFYSHTVKSVIHGNNLSCCLDFGHTLHMLND